MYNQDEMYIIQCQSDDDLLWSNDDGWGDGLDFCTYFTQEETQYLNLPIEGKWILPSQYFKRELS